MSNANNGPWGPRPSRSAKPKRAPRLPPGRAMPFYVIGAAMLTGTFAGGAFELQRVSQKLLDYDKQHPMLPLDMARQLVDLSVGNQQRTDRLERCVQDGMKLDTFSVAEPVFTPKSKDIKFILNSADQRTSLFIDSNQFVLDEAASRRPWHYAISACQRYVYDGNWQAAQRSIRKAHFNPARLLVGG